MRRQLQVRINSHQRLNFAWPISGNCLTKSANFDLTNTKFIIRINKAFSRTSSSRWSEFNHNPQLPTIVAIDVKHAFWPLWWARCDICQDADQCAFLLPTSWSICRSFSLLVLYPDAWLSFIQSLQLEFYNRTIPPASRSASIWKLRYLR